MFGSSKIRLLGQSAKLIIIPVISIIILVVLFTVLVNIGFYKISSLYSDLKQTQETERILTEKLNILREVKPNVLSKADVSVYALPDRSPGLWMLSQIRSSMEGYNVLIDTAGVTDAKLATNNLNQTDLSIEMTGNDLSSVINFIKGIEQMLPVSLISKVDFENKEKLVTAQILISGYWSELPTTLPALTQPIKDLSPQEQEILNKIVNLSPPVFTQLNPQPEIERQNPFN